MSVYTTDLTKVGTHLFEIVVSYQNFGSISSSVVTFEIELIHPCETATLTIDTSTIHLPPTAISMTQIIGDAASTLDWTDSVVSSTVTSAGTCGSYTHEVWDVTTSAEVAPSTSIFTISTTGPNYSL